jgi:hypothetical protein
VASRRLRRRIFRATLVTGIAWLLIAYLVLPALWSHYEGNPVLERSPRITHTSDGEPGDPLNVGLVADDTELHAAMTAAGWSVAAALGVKSDLEIAGSVVLDRPDPTAPVSDHFLFGRKQDVAFEKAAGESARHRHHVRFWRWDEAGAAGRPLWIGSATFDESVGFSHTTGQITHHIAPDLDAERDSLFASLAAVGQLASEYRATGVGATLAGWNGGGDRYFTDGEIWVGVIPRGNAKHAGPPELLADPPSVAAKNWLFANLRPVLGGL